jgi:DNA polymerase III epsilon subunit-like protein
MEGPKNTSLPSHTGLLREDLLALRHILGLSTDEACKGVCTELSLPNSSKKDLLLIGVDVETMGRTDEVISGQDFHIGISVLDTRSLQTLVNSQSSANNPTQLIESFQYTFGDSKSCQKASEKFLFGNTEAIEISDLKDKIENLSSGRYVALIFHGAHEDLKFLQNLDIDLKPIYIIDTVKAAQFPLQLYYRYSLERLLDVLDIPYAALHSAGNDAHFALRASLMIAVKDTECRSDRSHETTIQALRHIAHAPRPFTRGEMHELELPAMRERKRLKELNKARRKERSAANSERRRVAREMAARVGEPSLSPPRAESPEPTQHSDPPEAA